MAYSTGILSKRVDILNKVAPEQKAFGETTTYEKVATVWANVTWLKGAKRLAEASLDAMDTVMIRMRWNDKVTRDSRLAHDGKTYQIQSVHDDHHQNIMQITATELAQ